MPSAQVIDVNPNPRTQLTSLEKTLGAFSARNRQNQVQQAESDALSEIYRKYQNEGSQIEDVIFKINQDINISPSMKVQAANQAVQMGKINAELQRQAAKELQESQKNKGIVADLESRRGLSPGSLAAYESDPKMAEQISREPTRTQASKPIDEDQLKRLEEVRADPEYQKAPLAKKYQLLTKNKISKENADAEVKYAAEEEKLAAEQLKLDKAEQRIFHKESEKFDEEVSKSANSAKNQLSAIKDTRKAIESGNVGPNSLANMFRGLGAIGDKISSALITGDEATVQASIPAFLEGRKELFGVRLSDADLRLLQDKLPDIGKSTEANTAILNLMEKTAQASILKSNIAKDIKKANGGLRPLGFRDEVEEVFNQMMELVKIISPSGYEIYIPAYQVSDALDAGGKLEDE
jgi:hypothetical protein